MIIIHEWKNKRSNIPGVEAAGPTDKDEHGDQLQVVHGKVGLQDTTQTGP